jgi:FkbM family methyltransferase
MSLSTLDLLAFGVHCLYQKIGGEITVLQIGANDGRGDDPIGSLIRRYKLRATLVEPISSAFTSLVDSYRDNTGIEFFQLAIGDHTGELEMHMPLGAESELRLTQKASFSESIARKHARDGRVSRVCVPVLTFADFLERSGLQSVTVFVVDTEGYDFHILRQLFESSLRPEIIQLEIVHLDERERNGVRNLMSSNGYKFVENQKDCVAFRTLGAFGDF